MKTLPLIATITLTLIGGACGNYVLIPDLSYSAVSKRILLVDVSERIVEKVSVFQGIELDKILVTGTLVETVRGSDRGPNFKSISNATEVIDRKQALKMYGEDYVEGQRRSKPFTARSCRAGRRYVVIFLYRTANVLYYEVPKDSEDWRKKIVPFIGDEHYP